MSDPKPNNEAEYEFKILVNNFNDGYQDRDFESEHPEAYKALSNIHKVSPDIETYEKDIATYNRYIDEAESYYGGKVALKYLRKKFGEIKGYPTKPKLKKKLEKKYNSAIQYSIGKHFDPITVDEIAELDAKLYAPTVPIEEIEFEAPTLTRNLKRAVRAEINSSSLKRNKIASEVAFSVDIISQISSSIDEIMDDPNNINSDDKIMKLKEHLDFWDATHDENTYDDVSSEDLLPSSSDYSMYGRRINNGTSTFIYKKMIEAGLKPFDDDALSSMSDDKKQLYSRELGSEYVMTPKQLKKYRKKQKKAQKEYNKEYGKHIASSNRALLSMLSSRDRLNKIKGGK